MIAVGGFGQVTTKFSCDNVKISALMSHFRSFLTHDSSSFATIQALENENSSKAGQNLAKRVNFGRFQNLSHSYHSASGSVTCDQGSISEDL
jgi:hypothetical protein